jgi:steroid delta-isomerase-like uncharacterized protein
MNDYKPQESMSARTIATQFFDRYRDQNVDGMVDLFTPSATLEYVPLNLQGTVSEAGAGVWNALIDTFPDLTNQVQSLRQDETGRVAFVDVWISGTQHKTAFGIPNQGKSYNLRHLFIFETNEMGKITSLVSFWDNADWYTQLGKTTLV